MRQPNPAQNHRYALELSLKCNCTSAYRHPLSVVRRRLCQGDCDCHARVLYRARRTERASAEKAREREREREREGIQEMAKSKLRKKSQSAAALSLARPSVRPSPLPFLLRSVGRAAVVGEFFPQRTNSPTFCCSGVFPSPSQSVEEEKVDISSALSFYLSEHRQLLRDDRGRRADRRRPRPR